MNQVKIGKYIAEKRKKKELTQKELAEKLLVSDKAVSLIVNIMGAIEHNAQVYFDDGGERYECSQTEIQQLKHFLNSLPVIHDEINNEMGINSPGISHLY